MIRTPGNTAARPRPIGARYTAREQATAMRDLVLTYGEGWASDLPRAEFLAELEQALATRYGSRA